MVQKTIYTKAKANLILRGIIWDLNVHYFRAYYLSHNISSKVQTLGYNNKCFFPFEKSKPKNPKLIPLDNNRAEPAKRKDRKNKRKEFSKV